MRWKQIEDEPKTFVLIFATGDEIASQLQQFAKDKRLRGSSRLARSFRVILATDDCGLPVAGVI